MIFQAYQLNCLTIELNATGGNRRAVSIPLLSQTSVPTTTLPMARQTLSTDINIPSVSPATAVFPNTQTTVGVAGLDVLRRGTELVADRIVAALGSIALLIDIIRNTSANGDVAWNNLGSSSQSLTNRFLRVSMNTATNLLQDLNSQIAVSANPNAVLRNFMNIPGIERIGFPQGYISSILRSTPLASGNQVFFPNRVFSTVQENNASSATPEVTELVNSSSGGAGSNNDSLPTITTISTTRPGLNIPVSTTTDFSTANIPSNESESITSEVETFLENLGNAPNVGITP